MLAKVGGERLIVDTRSWIFWHKVGAEGIQEEIVWISLKIWGTEVKSRVSWRQSHLTLKWTWGRTRKDCQTGTDLQ